MPGQSETTQSENKTTTTQPWAPAQPALQGLLASISGKIGNTDLTAAETRAFNALAGARRPGIRMPPASAALPMRCWPGAPTARR